MFRIAPRSCAPALALFAAVTAAAAQDDYRPEQIQALGIKFMVSKKLGQVPMTLGSGEKYVKAQFQPADLKDRINLPKGTFPWEMFVLAFPKVVKDDGTPEDPRAARRRASNFKEYVESPDKDP